MGVFTQFMLFSIVKYTFCMSRKWLLDLELLKDFSRALHMSLVTKMVVFTQFLLFSIVKSQKCCFRPICLVTFSTPRSLFDGLYGSVCIGPLPQNLKQTPKKSVQQKLKFLATWPHKNSKHPHDLEEFDLIYLHYK